MFTPFILWHNLQPALAATTLMPQPIRPIMPARSRELRCLTWRHTRSLIDTASKALRRAPSGIMQMPARAAFQGERQADLPMGRSTMMLPIDGCHPLAAYPPPSTGHARVHTRLSTGCPDALAGEPDPY